MMKPFIPRAPVVMGAITGTFAGSFVLVVLILLLAPSQLERGIEDIALILILTAVVVPISAFGIVIFGYPAAGAVGEAWRKPWVGVAAALMGALAGFITKIVLVSVIAGGMFGTASAGPVDPGMVYGACVGLAYWLFERDWRIRDEARRKAEGPGEEIPSSSEFSRLP